MEIREFAERVLFATTLEDKLAPPSGPLTDEFPGRAMLAPGLPGRPQDLVPRARHDERARFPRDASLLDETQRARLLHFFANHELLAVELMALALLKFPDAPKAFRKGVAYTLREEQDHTRWYANRMRECGLRFGDLGVSRMIWDHIAPMDSPLEYVGRLSLTFEQSNLDYAKHYCHVLGQAGDDASAAILGRIYRDEIAHVGYGLKWLRRWKEDKESDWEAFRKTLRYPLSPIRAKGVVPFNAEGRRMAGLDEDFIRNLRIFEQSRGRTPDVFWFNPGAEEELAAAATGRPYHPAARAEALAADLEPAFALAAHTDDVVLVRRLPTAAHRRHLCDLGLPMPELVPLDNAFRVLGERRLHAPAPWAWSPSARAAFHPLAALFSAAPPPTDPDWFSKATAAAVLARLAETGADTGPLPIVVETPGQTEAAGRVFGADGWTDLVAKPVFSLAGRGHRRFAAGTCPQHLPQSAVVEPWLPKVFEFSAHYDATGTDLRHIGFARLQSDHAGRWKSSSTGQKFLKGLPPELAAFLTLALPAYDTTVRSALRDVLARHPHHGPMGVDAFVWRDHAGNLRLRPVVEINPRWTMGRLAIALQKRFAPHRWLTLHTVSPGAAAGLPPLVQVDGRPDHGSIRLTDPAQATSHIVVATIGNAPWNANPAEPPAPPCASE